MQFIDLSKQQSLIKKKLEKRIANVLSHGKYILGPEVYELEQKLAEFVGVGNCISCSSGTDALLIPLLAKNIGRGDAIITTPFTYIATAEVIRLVGATPIFVDINSDTYNINSELIEDAIKLSIKKGLHPKAIIPVDLFGLPANYPIIDEIAKRFGLFIIEDAAQAFGANINGNMACSFGDVAATSFFPAKPLGAYGDGGAIFTNDNSLAEAMKSIRVHGSGIDKYENVRLGINGRLDTLQAAILLEKLLLIPSEMKNRNRISNKYTQYLSDNYFTPEIPNGFNSAWAQYSIRTKLSLDRKDIMQSLSVKKIPSMVYYKIPLHLQKVFSDLKYRKGDFPVTEKVSENIFSIPIDPYMETHKQDLIIEVLNTIE